MLGQYLWEYTLTECIRVCNVDVEVDYLLANLLSLLWSMGITMISSSQGFPHLTEKNGFISFASRRTFLKYRSMLADDKHLEFDYITTDMPQEVKFKSMSTLEHLPEVAIYSVRFRQQDIQLLYPK